MNSDIKIYTQQSLYWQYEVHQMTACNSFGKANVVQDFEEEVQPVLRAMSIGAGMHLALFLRKWKRARSS